MLSKSVLIVVFGLLFSLQAFASGTVLIDGKVIKNRDHLHTYVAKELNFNRYYARTVDSLYDTLSTDYTGETVIKIKHVSILKAKLGSEYIEGMIQSIMDAAEDNPRVIMVLE
jgi:RNAse (barnase) inhibitor barstar